MVGEGDSAALCGVWSLVRTTGETSGDCMNESVESLVSKIVEEPAGVIKDELDKNEN